MPRKFLPQKPGKSALLVPAGRKNPETIADATHGMQRGEARTGFLHGVNLARKPDFIPVAENLSENEKVRKGVCRDLLIKLIIPNALSTKSTPEQDRRSLSGKLNKLNLVELERFLPDRLRQASVDELQTILNGDGSLTEEEKNHMQDSYRNISP